MKKFLVYQLLIRNRINSTMNIDTTIRIVNAENSEEAINKFKVEIDKIQAESILNDIEEILKIIGAIQKTIKSRMDKK